MTEEQIDKMIQDAPAVIAEQLEVLREDIKKACAAVIADGKSTLAIGCAIDLALADNPPTYKCKASVTIKHQSQSDTKTTGAADMLSKDFDAESRSEKPKRKQKPLEILREADAAKIDD